MLLNGKRVLQHLRLRLTMTNYLIEISLGIRFLKLYRVNIIFFLKEPIILKQNFITLHQEPELEWQRLI